MFYRFNQNNSGGYFDGYHNVIIEADNAEQANEYAERSGYVYFEDRGDCVGCCGYRWSAFWLGDNVADGYKIFDDVEEAIQMSRGGYFTSTGDTIVIFADGSTRVE